MFVKTRAVNLIKNSVFSCSSSFLSMKRNPTQLLTNAVLFSRISIRLQEQNLYAGEFCYVWQQG